MYACLLYVSSATSTGKIMSGIHTCVLRATYGYVVKHIYHSLSCAQCLSLVLSVTRNFFLANSSRKC